MMARLKSRAVWTSSGITVGCLAIDLTTLQTSTRPSGRSAVVAISGSARDAGSLITRKAANGSPTEVA